jgi:Uma2 family endonuclease
MSVGAAPPLPAYFAHAGFRLLSVAEYHKLMEIGILTEHDRVELLEGHMVNKMSQNPPHSNSGTNAEETLRENLPQGWRLRAEKPVTLADSEPEPDIVIARGTRITYASRHPGPGDIGLVVEICDSSLTVDRTDMVRIYARANLPIYWIINVIDRQVEVYTDPRPNDPVPAYATRTDYKAGDSVPFILDGQVVAQLPVNDLLG